MPSTNPARPRLLVGLAIVAIILLSISGLLYTNTRATMSGTPVPTTRPTDLGADKVTNRAFPSLSYGIQAFLWWDASVRGADLEYLRLMRFGYVKQIFGWQDIEPLSADQPDWSVADEVVAETEYRGIKLVVRVGKPPDWALRQPPTPQDVPFDVPAFGEYCGALASRYKGRIVAYQVWNEPNLSREWNDNPPNAAAYVKLLAACYTAIKAADPAAIVISAGLAPTGTGLPAAIPDEEYLWQLYQAGISQYYDVLGLHAPGYASAPETPPDDPALDGNRWQAFRHVEDMRAIMVANGDAAKQVAILELGWTTDTRDTITDENGADIPNPYRWHAVTEEQQAKYMVGAYTYAGKHWRPWMGLMSAIYIGDRRWTPDREEYWWAIIEPHFYPRIKAAFVELANMERFIDDEYIPVQDGAASSKWYTPLPPRQ